MSWTVARRFRAARLSTGLVRVIFQRTRTEELHLDEQVNWSTYQERSDEARCKARTRHCSGPWARIEVMLWPTRSWLSRTARYRCVWELYRSSSTPETALCVLWRRAGRSTVWPQVGETHIGTATRGYLQLWAMDWAGSAPRWSPPQFHRWYFRPNQSWSSSGRAWACNPDGVSR